MRSKTIFLIRQIQSLGYRYRLGLTILTRVCTRTRDKGSNPLIDILKYTHDCCMKQAKLHVLILFVLTVVILNMFKSSSCMAYMAIGSSRPRVLSKWKYHHTAPISCAFSYKSSRLRTVSPCNTYINSDGHSFRGDQTTFLAMICQSHQTYRSASSLAVNNNLHGIHPLSSKFCLSRGISGGNRPPHTVTPQGLTRTSISMTKTAGTNEYLKLDDNGKKYIKKLVKDMILSLDEAVFDGMNPNDLKDSIESPSHNLSNDEDLLNSVIRIYCTHSEPNFNMPWQRRKQESSTSSGFVIHTTNRHRPNQPARSYILTNAHSVEYGSIIQVKKRQSEKKYLARALAGDSMTSYHGLSKSSNRS